MGERRASGDRRWATRRHCPLAASTAGRARAGPKDSSTTPRDGQIHRAVGSRTPGPFTHPSTLPHADPLDRRSASFRDAPARTSANRPSDRGTIGRAIGQLVWAVELPHCPTSGVHSKKCVGKRHSGKPSRDVIHSIGRVNVNVKESPAPAAGPSRLEMAGSFQPGQEPAGGDLA